MTSVAFAQPDRLPDTRPPLEDLIARLDSPMFQARRQATADLARRDDLTPADAERLLGLPGLSPEQRLRVEAAAAVVFERGPRAALGIRFAPERDAGVRIQEAVAGFPASDLLRAGDEVVQVQGAAVVNQATLRAAILSRDPGDTLALTVRRDGELLQIDAPLGSHAGLMGAPLPGPIDLLAAWTLRRSRDRAAEHADALRPAPVRLAGQPPSPEPGSQAWAEAFATPDTPRSVRVGGQGRSGVDLSLTQLLAMDASRSLTLDDLDDLGEADLAVQTALLRERRMLALQDLDRIGQLINGGNLDRAGRDMMRTRFEEVQARLQVIEEQVRVLDIARQRVVPR